MKQATETVKNGGKFKPHHKRLGGRAKGTPNKSTGAIRDMIIQALNEAGGVKYLLLQSKKNPTAFMGLVGKVLPTQLSGEDDGPIQIIIQRYGQDKAPE